MYSSSNLIVYSENNVECKPNVFSTIIECDTLFKELNSEKLAFHALKNPQNYVILIVKSKDFLHKIENIAKSCHNYQDRIFVVYCSQDIVDFFFQKFCFINNLEPLKNFIIENVNGLNITPHHQTSTLIHKLVELELEKLDVHNKYIGFKYLVSVLANALSKNFYTINYIDFFECVARTYSSPIDSIERDVRHMLLTTWKNSAKFKNTLQASPYKIDKPNAKNILNAVLMYIKDII